MTRKDLQLIASIIERCDFGDDYPENLSRRYFVAKEFADALLTTNPKFDRERFLKACGVKL